MSNASKVPDEFLCPITRMIMKDPVVTALGYTYERSAITEWFSGGRPREPLTGEPLSSTMLIPNRCLKSRIVSHLDNARKTTPHASEGKRKKQRGGDNLLELKHSLTHIKSTFARVDLQIEAMMTEVRLQKSLTDLELELAHARDLLQSKTHAETRQDHRVRCLEREKSDLLSLVRAQDARAQTRSQLVASLRRTISSLRRRLALANGMKIHAGASTPGLEMKGLTPTAHNTDAQRRSVPASRAPRSLPWTHQAMAQLPVFDCDGNICDG